MLAVDDEVDKGESSQWTIKESPAKDHEKSLHQETMKRVSGERPRKESDDHKKSLRQETTNGACKTMRWHTSNEESTGL